MLARRDADLGLYQIDTKDLLGNRVLDLQARVGLDEHIRQFLRLRVDEKLERTQTLVAQPGRHAQRVLGDAFAQRLRQAGAGRDFHQFLKAPLQRAFTLAQRERPFAAITQNLHLDMAGARHQALHIDAIHTKRGSGLAAAALIGGSDLSGVDHGAHAAPAATAYGLDHDAAGTVGFLRREEGLGLLQRHGLLAAGHQRYLTLLGQCAGSGLVTQQSQLLGCGTDEAQACRRTGAREVRVLAEKSIAGMQSVAAMLLRDPQQLCAIEIGRRAAGIQRHGLIGVDMQGRRIVLCIHGQAGDTQLLQRADDAHRDFATVGDQDFFKHGNSR